MLTLGSLFDGSGGFPLAGAMNGFEPVWASEVEPYPIAVTRSRFPQMIHLGNVCDVDGATVRPVDVITFGSPCQDLSVAGKRAGLKHEDHGDDETTRSGLFMEAVRIITEMREATNGRYPTFAVWENVPGALSSSGGDDFLAVLENLAKIADPEVSIPKPDKWCANGEIVGNGFSLAWRIIDARHFGVTVRDGDTDDVLVRGTPQRRRRIYLVADFTGTRAGKILFECAGVQGDSEPCAETRQGTSADVKGSTGDAECLTPWDYQSKRIFSDEGAFATLPSGETSGQNQQAVCYGISAYESNAMKSSNPHSGIYEANTSWTLDLNGGNPACNQGGIAVVEPMLFENHSQDTRFKGPLDVSPMLPAQLGTGGNNTPFVVEQWPFRKTARPTSKDDATVWAEADHANTVNTFDVGETRANELVVSAPVVYDGSNITSPVNAANPQPGDPCHTLSTDSRNYVVEQTYCLQGSMIGRADKNGPQGDGVNEDVSFTCNTTDRHAVAYRQGGFADYVENEVGTFQNTGIGWWKESPVAETLRTPCGGDSTLANVCDQKTKKRYLVRRLTPTECARLQGFPDTWGHPDVKTELTDEEYTFWQTVRDTYAEINGKPQKTYKREQMLKWYNNLHTDSAEFKMWGNGIALPCAHYVLNRIAKELTNHDNQNPTADA